MSAVIRVGEFFDSWGRTTEGCQCRQDLGRTTWTLCGKEPVAIAVYGEGGEYGIRRICANHLSGALRKRNFWADDPTELRALDGELTHRLERHRPGRKGQLYPVEPVSYPSQCPTCRGTGGGQYNDCPTCDGNGVV